MSPQKRLQRNLQLKDQQKSYNRSMNLKFGTDGIRGPVETKVTPEACLRIGHAAGIVFKELGWDTVLIGKDTRVSGYMLEAALQAVSCLLE